MLTPKFDEPFLGLVDQLLLAFRPGGWHFESISATDEHWHTPSAAFK
jgi:hypothetical protein